jgi:multidrug efflux pump subunit AcrB
MNPAKFALRRPWTVIVVLLAIVLTCGLALRPKSFDTWLVQLGLELPVPRMAVDIFPSLNLPVIYVCQPYGGMDAAQMEGLLTNYYEYHFLYISNIHHVESRNIQGMALMKLFFHPGTNMAQAMAETINYVNRSRAFMPPGTVSPFVMRFDTGSVPVGYLVLSSGTRTIGEIQDQALFKVRPLFSSLPGVSAPPPFGGSVRSIVVRAKPDRLRAYGLSPDDVVQALSAGNTISPSGNLHLGDSYPVVPTNALIKNLDDFGAIPLRQGPQGSVYLRDIGTVEDSTDLTVGYALVNSRRAVYILATKRAEASTMSVIDEIKNALPRMQKELPADIRVSFEFDQSPYVVRAVRSLFTEGALGAVLTGLMVLLFLRDWRSALIVVLNIPLAILSAVVALWIGGHTINLMTLGGLALAVGILVDETTVEIENIHVQLRKHKSVARAVREGNRMTAIPRLLSMFCVLAVFVPSFFMRGAARELFVPLALAVGFSMIASYLLSSTFVPVVATWLLKPNAHPEGSERDLGARLRRVFETATGRTVRWGRVTLCVYLVACGAILWLGGQRLGIEIFPASDAGEFRLRLRAPDGTHFSRTEQIAIDVLDTVKKTVGLNNVALTLGYVGTIPASFPINGVYQWSRGPEEGLLRIALTPGSGVRTEEMKETLRHELARQFPQVRFSFEPADIISEVMSFGATTPIEIAARGSSLQENREYLAKVQKELQSLRYMRDVQFAQSLDYPTVDVKLDRERAGLSGASAAEFARSMVAATSSSRFVVPNYWPDSKTGIGYQVQLEIPQALLTSADDLGAVPVANGVNKALLLRDIAQIQPGTMPGQYDRYNMKRELSLTANISGADLGQVSRDVNRLLARLEKNGDKPESVTVEIRGQIPPLRQILGGLTAGLFLALVVILLLLTANFQSWRLSLVTVLSAPAVLAGVVIMLLATHTTINIQSMIGTIMALGVAMANGILFVTFAERERLDGLTSQDAAVRGAGGRVRAILMTSVAMVAGMVPMALGLGDTGPQTAPLGLAVIGGLLAATAATLFILPAAFTVIQAGTGRQSASLDPDDPESSCFDATQVS